MPITNSIRSGYVLFGSVAQSSSEASCASGFDLSVCRMVLPPLASMLTSLAFSLSVWVLGGDGRSGGEFPAAGPPAPAWTTVSFPGWSPPSQSLSPLSRVRFRGLSLGWDQGEVRLACLPVVVFRGLSFKVTSEHRHLF